MGNRLKGESKLIEIYPNPTTDDVHIYVRNQDETYSYKIIDNLGHEIFSRINCTGNSDVNISQFSNGIYFLKVESQSNSSEHKIIKL